MKTVIIVGIILVFVQVYLAHVTNLVWNGFVWLHWTFPTTIILFGVILLIKFLKKEHIE